MNDASRLTICAIIAVRTEAPYLRFLLPHLLAEAIDVVIIDNGSSDQTQALIESHRGAPIIQTVSLPYLGYFSLHDQLRAKHEAISHLKHDWVIHQDADEILEHRDPEKTLRDAIGEAEVEGFNVLNFEEFCFIPEPRQDCYDQDYRQCMTRYYFFSPCTNRLNRVWKRGLGFDNLGAMGHRLSGADLRIAPTIHSLRHYIVLSQEHAYRKYVGRTFANEELARGFHRRRQGLSMGQLALPTSSPHLRNTDPRAKMPLSRLSATAQHFWEWKREP